MGRDRVGSGGIEGETVEHGTNPQETCREYTVFQYAQYYTPAWTYMSVP